MTWITTILALAVIYLVACIYNEATRAVNQRLPLGLCIKECVMSWMLMGGEGARTVLFHLDAHILIVVSKHLVPISFRGKAQVTIKMWRLPESRRYQPERGYKLPLRRLSHPCRVVWRFRLPRVRDGKLAFVKECGGSLSTVQASLQELVSADPVMREDSTFYVWAEKVFGWRDVGVFEDAGSDQE